MIANSSEKISFHSEEINFSIFNPSKISTWVCSAIENESRQIQFLNFIFCNDEYLHKINVEYLNHDSYTDVITFPYSESEIIEGDIFISIDRIRENAKKFNVDFENELHRVMIHGVLHLIGFGDKTEKEKKLMRSKEDEYLTALN